jgi:23S rRNA-/tRNA-specific pseudouridylate synthase
MCRDQHGWMRTTGIVLFARTRHLCRVMQRQFLDGAVDKRYLVR